MNGWSKTILRLVDIEVVEAALNRVMLAMCPQVNKDRGYHQHDFGPSLRNG
jgi:hypothetical protein